MICDSIIYLNQTPLCDWCVVSCRCKYIKKMCVSMRLDYMLKICFIILCFINGKWGGGVRGGGVICPSL